MAIPDCKPILWSPMWLYLACLTLRSPRVFVVWSGAPALDHPLQRRNFLMNIRTVVRAHLMRERVDVLIAVIAPLVLMFESGYACGWVFANGDLRLNNPNTYLALGRGIFLEW